MELNENARIDTSQINDQRSSGGGGGGGIGGLPIGGGGITGGVQAFIRRRKYRRSSFMAWRSQATPQS